MLLPFFFFNDQTPNPPYLIKNPYGTVTLVVAKPTGATGLGQFGLPMACAFCDVTASLAVGTWAQKHGTGKHRQCFFSHNFPKELKASNLQQFTIGKHDGWEYLPISDLQGWQPCIPRVIETVPAAAAVGTAPATAPGAVAVPVIAAASVPAPADAGTAATAAAIATTSGRYIAAFARPSGEETKDKKRKAAPSKTNTQGKQPRVTLQSDKNKTKENNSKSAEETVVWL